MSNLKEKTTVELKVLLEKIGFELEQRKNEEVVFVLEIIGNEESEIIDETSLENNKEYIIRQLKNALINKNRIFNIKVKSLPKSDYDDIKD